MAQEDKYAFDAMNAADPDRNITGGAMEYSEYEMDMSPKQQKSFEKKTLDLFRNLYNVDPLVDQKKLPYKSWLKTLSSERIEELSKEYEDVKAPRNPEAIIANDLIKQASKHWGGVEGFELIRKMGLASD
jgi:hypothetical protein|tara:strand:- start:78 stop:467 length:390 start_codon:yes stop_codon:yes gene_type:complete